MQRRQALFMMGGKLLEHASDGMARVLPIALNVVMMQDDFDRIVQRTGM